MTFVEKYYEERPELLQAEKAKAWIEQSWVKRCPYNYGYEKNSTCPGVSIETDCLECWNREMPEREEEGHDEGRSPAAEG